MLVVLCILSFFCLAFFAVLLIFLRSAPEGYEDETGFHRGRERNGSLAVPQVPAACQIVPEVTIVERDHPEETTIDRNAKVGEPWDSKTLRPTRFSF